YKRFGFEGEPRDPMIDITINGERKSIPERLTLADLLEQIGFDRRRIAVEVNREVVPLPRHAEHSLQRGDAVEIVTLVGGGSGAAPPPDKPLGLGQFPLSSRL